MTRFSVAVFTAALLAVLAALLGLFGALGSYASGLATGFIYGALTTAALLACIAFGRRAGRAVALDEPDAGSGLALVPTSAAGVGVVRVVRSDRPQLTAGADTHTMLQALRTERAHVERGA